MKWKKFAPYIIAAFLAANSHAIPENSSDPTPMKLEIAISSKNLTTELVVAGATGSSAVKCRVLDVPIQTFLYNIKNAPKAYTGPLSNSLAAIRDPIAKRDYIVPYSPIMPNFYISENSGMIACAVIWGSLAWSKRYFEVPQSIGGVNATIEQFSEAFDDKNLVPLLENEQSLSLSVAAPPSFFVASPGSSQPGDVTISAIDMTDGILRLDLLSPKGLFKGSFWIDLKAQMVIRSVVDGQEMKIGGLGGAYAVPAK